MQDNEQQTGEVPTTIVITFADSKLPEFKEQKGLDYIKFDTDDAYPAYLIKLLKKSAKHGSIVKYKKIYIYGGGLQVDTPSPQADEFIRKYNSLIEKNIYDRESFGMFYIQCIPTRDRSGFTYHHLSYERMRSNADNTEFYYKKDWSNKREERKIFPAFDPTKKVTSVFCFKEYSPGNDVYGLPGFVAAINYIEADIEVSKHTLTNAKSGWSASKLVTFTNGEPTEAMKRSIVGRLTNVHTGSEGSKIVVQFVNDPTKKTLVDDLGTSDLTKEDFSQVDELISSNLYAGHCVTNPALFGIPAMSSKLSSNSGAEMKMSYDIFKSTYVAAQKQSIEEVYNFLAQYAGVTGKFTLIDVEPVGYDFTEATVAKVAPRSWLMEKLGIDTTKYTDAPVGDGTTPQAGNAPVNPAAQAAAPGAPVNDNLKNLTAKQFQHVDRILKRYAKGSISREMAAFLLKSGFAMTDADVDIFLGAEGGADQFSSDEDVALLFGAHGEPRESFNTYERRLATFKNEYDDVESKIEAIRQANPKATPESIAKTLNIDVAVVKEYVAGATDAVKVASKLPKFEVRYSYEKRPEVEGPELLPTSRPFCVKMIGLNRLYTRADIQKISQYLGYDVMRRAGGFWNNDGTTEYHCRHEFFSQIVIKKQ